MGGTLRKTTGILSVGALALAALGCQTASHSEFAATQKQPGVAQYARTQNLADQPVLAVMRDSASGRTRDDAVEDASSLPPDTLRTWAHLACQRGDTARALELYGMLLNNDPDCSAAWNNLGLIHVAEEHWPQAIEALQQATRLKPGKPLYHNNLGVALLCHGELDEAIQQFSVAVGEAAAHYNAGVVLLQQGRPEHSAQEFLLAILRDPSLKEAQEALNLLVAADEVKAKADNVGTAHFTAQRDPS